MKENVRFYSCSICGNVIGLIDGNMDNVTCCGRKMELMQANTNDASQEKHVPVYEKVEDEIVVKVGETEHAMEKDHYIMWIAQVSDNTTTRIRLYPEQGTEVRFKYIPKSIVYAYCNKHGLWKTNIN